MRIGTSPRLPRGLVGVGLVAAAALFLIAPAAGSGSVKFGSKLNKNVQPSNGVPGLYCNNANHSKTCTYILWEAYGRPNGGQKAPRSGTIKQIRGIAGNKVTIRLQIAKVKKKGSNYRAKVIRNGPKLHFKGQGPSNIVTYKVEKFRTHLHVGKGQVLAYKAKRSSLVRCSSGGSNTLLYQPPLAPGGIFRTQTNTDGCWSLLEAVIK